MKLEDLPAGISDWTTIPSAVDPGESGTATTRTRQFGSLRLRLIDFSPGYIAGQWCAKGHIVYVVSGTLMIEHQDGRRYVLDEGRVYHASDSEGTPHRVVSDSGARVFVVD